MSINAKRVAGAALLCVICWTGGRTARAAVVHRVVAAKGMAAPGGETYAAFGGVPLVNDNGQIAFESVVSGASGFLSGVFRYDGDITTEIALQGDAAPGGGNLGSFESGAHRINSSGQVAYRAHIAETSEYAIFRSDGTDAVAIARLFTAAPGGGFYSHAAYPELADNGQVAFIANLVGGPANYGLFRHDGSNGVAMAIHGTAAPAGGNYNLPFPHLISANGVVTFQSDLTGGSSLRGVFRHDGTTGTALALEGLPAPGGGTYFAFGTPQINPSGQMAHIVLVKDGSNLDGIVRHGPVSDAIMMVRQGMPASGGGTYESFYSLDLNSVGEVAYKASMFGGLHTEGVFRHNGAAATPIALQGMLAPGTATTTFFSEFDHYATRLNNAGVVAFRGELIGAGVNAANNSGIWFGTDASNLTLLARAGDSMLVNGMNRTLATLPENDVFSISESGIAWQAYFTDNTSAIIYTTFASAPGDFDGSGSTDGADFLLWQRQLGSSRPPGTGADGSGDGAVNAAYLALWRSGFGQSSAALATHAVPEPTAAWIAFVAAIAFSKYVRPSSQMKAASSGHAAQLQ